MDAPYLVEHTWLHRVALAKVVKTVPVVARRERLEVQPHAVGGALLSVVVASPFRQGREEPGNNLREDYRVSKVSVSAYGTSVYLYWGWTYSSLSSNVSALQHLPHG